MKKLLALIIIIAGLIISITSCDTEEQLKTNPTIIIIDNCEYISYYLGNYGGLITHKGNCKFCQKRQEESLNNLLMSIKNK